MKNFITMVLVKILNILFLYNILGTCYGCLIGLLLLSLQSLITSYIPVVGSIKWYGFIAFGVLIFNIKPMIKKQYEDPRIEKKLKYIREMLKEGNLSDKEKRAIWRNTIESVSKELSDTTYDINSKDNPNNSATI